MLGTRLDFSTTFHSQTEDQTKRLNKILEDMLCASVLLDFAGSWYSKLHLMEFGYNNFQATIDMTHEALYEKRRKTPLCWDEVGLCELGPELVQVTNDAVQKIGARICST